MAAQPRRLEGTLMLITLKTPKANCDKTVMCAQHDEILYVGEQFALKFQYYGLLFLPHPV